MVQSGIGIVVDAVAYGPFASAYVAEGELERKGVELRHQGNGHYFAYVHRSKEFFELYLEIRYHHGEFLPLSDFDVDDCEVVDI